MSPTKYQESEVIPKGRLSINKESHMIQKTSSSPSSSSINENSGQSKPTKRQPVIIYTHTPKVIHVHARDFMSIVQRLTGMSNSDAEKPVKSEMEAAKEEENSFSGDQKDCGMKNNEASSGLMKENYSPFFTTNSNDIFSSSRFNSFFQSPSSFLDYNM